MNEIKQQMDTYIDKNKKEITSLADHIFDHPEVGFQEYHACKLLTDQLSAHGFQVETGIADLPTSFKAKYQHGIGGPTIGLLCEYDAIENIGHACGHHMQGPSILWAAFAVKDVLKDSNFSLVIFGTPAEETQGGKISMQEKGCFDHLDVALMMHASPVTTTDKKCMAMTELNVTFHGKSAHAAIMPESGRSALDAILLTCNGIEFLREHVKEDSRLHYTITNAGGPSNVVPEKAEATFGIRSYNSAYLEKLITRVYHVIEGASLMTDTSYEIKRLATFSGKIPVLALNTLLMKNAELVGAERIREAREKTGSTDFGNVMYHTAGSCIRVAFVPEGTSSHSKEYVNAGKSEAAHACTVQAAKILAFSCYELIENPVLLGEVLSEFKENKIKMSKEV